MDLNPLDLDSIDHHQGMALGGVGQGWRMDTYNPPWQSITRDHASTEMALGATVCGTQNVPALVGP